MKMMIYIATFLMAIGANAQQPVDTLRAGPHMIIIPHKPAIKAAPYRIHAEPEVLPTDTTFPKIQYTTVDRQLETSFETTPIAAAKMKGVKLEKLEKGYVKAGGGSNNHSLFELDITNRRSRKQAVGLQLSHMSANPKLDSNQTNGYNDPKYGRNAVAVYGRRFLRKHLLDGRMSFDHSYHNLYGQGPDPGYEYTLPDSVPSIFAPMMNIGTEWAYQSFYKDSTKMNYRFDVDYRFGQGRGSAQENHATVKGVLSRYYETELVKLAGEIDYWTINDTAIAQSVIATINPHIESRKDRVYARVGLKSTAYFNDGAKIFFYPDVWGEYKLVKELLIPFVHLGGGMQRNTLGSVYADNPFVGTGQRYMPTNERFFVSGGLRGSITSKTSFLLSYSIRKVENQLFYVPVGQAPDVPYFKLVNDTMQVNQLKFQASHQQGERLEIKIGGSWYDRTVYTEQKAWHLPDLEAYGSVFYDLKDKIVANLTVQYIGARWAQSSGHLDEIALSTAVNGVELKPYVDLNVGIEYRYTSRLSAFVKFNNIAGGKYEKWLNYPVEGFHVLGGLSFTF